MTFDSILKLQKDTTEKIEGFGRRGANASKLIQELYRRPIVDIRRAQGILSLSRPSTDSLIQAMVEKGILEEITGNQRNREFVFMDYLKLF